MNGYHTRSELDRALREHADRETTRRTERFEARMATACVIGLIVLLVWQIAGKVAA